MVFFVPAKVFGLPGSRAFPKTFIGTDLKPIVAEDIGGCHKGSRARDTDCEELGENLPDDVHDVDSA